jgi:hypothetical protein
MTLIETKTLLSAAASIEFTSIPQTYTDLVILASCKTDRDATVDYISIAFNTITTDFTAIRLTGNGLVAVSNEALTRIFGTATGATSTANTFGNSSTYVSNYTGSTNKSWSVDQVAENNATEAFQDIVAGLWSNTAAITSIDLTPRVGTQFEIGSTISLYGITKGSDGIVTTS